MNLPEGSTLPRDRVWDFRRGETGSSLAGHAVRGTVWTLGAQWARMLVTLGSTAVLARLLSPTDYGLIGMVSAVIGIGGLLLKLGLAQATVQREHLTHEQVNVLFWINGAVGVALAAGTSGVSGLIAAFYTRPELVLITIAMSTSFVAGGFGVQHQALLTRQMRFRDLAVLEFMSHGVGLVAAIFLAFTGAGYWALVAMNIASQVTRLLLSWRLCEWRPSWPTRPRGVDGAGDLVRFGAGLSIFTVVNYVARNADNVIIGRALGAGPLGLYAKAYSLLLLPLDQLTTPLSQVALPTLSSLQQQPARFRSYYRTAVAMIALAATPLVTLMAVLADEVVALILGPQWAGAAPIFQVLAISGLAQAIGSANGWLYVAMGRTRAQAIWGLCSRPVLVLSFFLGLPWGAYGVAVSYTVAGYALLVPGFFFAVHQTPVYLRDIAAAVWRPLLASGALGLSAWGVRHLTVDAPTLLQVVASSLCGVIVYGAVVSALPQARRDVVSMYRTIRVGLQGPGVGRWG